MSYSIHLLDPQTKEVIQFSEPHHLAGGTYAIGGTEEAWLNITYNYAPHFFRVLGEGGIRSLYGKTGREAIPILEEAISKLGDDINADYWRPTEGNAKSALKNLMVLCSLAPHGIVGGD